MLPNFEVPIFNIIFEQVKKTANLPSNSQAGHSIKQSQAYGVGINLLKNRNN